MPGTEEEQGWHRDATHPQCTKIPQTAPEHIKKAKLQRPEDLRHVIYSVYLIPNIPAIPGKSLKKEVYRNLPGGWEKKSKLLAFLIKQPDSPSNFQ